MDDLIVTDVDGDKWLIGPDECGNVFLGMIPEALILTPDDAIRVGEYLVALGRELKAAEIIRLYDEENAS